MKIITKQNLSNAHFRDVEPGQVFIYDEGIYMKLDTAYRTHDECGYEEAIWSAVYLENGELCQFDGYEYVKLPVKVTPMEITF